MRHAIVHVSLDEAGSYFDCGGWHIDQPKRALTVDLLVERLERQRVLVADAARGSGSDEPE